MGGLKREGGRDKRILDSTRTFAILGLKVAKVCDVLPSGQDAPSFRALRHFVVGHLDIPRWRGVGINNLTWVTTLLALPLPTLGGVSAPRQEIRVTVP